MDLLVRQSITWTPDRLDGPNNVPIEVLLDRGIILVDKEDGPTSHEVATTVKRMFGGTVVTKVGHGGTLDPAVTGILPLLLNRAALVQDFILSSTKEYVGIMHLHDDVPDAEVLSMAETFTGPIYQRPPDRSAVARVVRVRKVERIEILEQVGRDVLFRVACEAGTYVRKLCVDIGEAIGCGAHLTELRRTRSGSFVEDKELVSIEEIGAAVSMWLEAGDESGLRRIVHPVERVFDGRAKLVVNRPASSNRLQGAVAANSIVAVTPAIGKGTEAIIFDEEGFVLGQATALMPAMVMIESSGKVAANIIKFYTGLGINA